MKILFIVFLIACSPNKRPEELDISFKVEEVVKFICKENGGKGRWSMNKKEITGECFNGRATKFKVSGDIYTLFKDEYGESEICNPIKSLIK